MKAVLLESHGPPSILQYKEIPDPVCNKFQVKIQIKSSSINHLDLWVRAGIPGLHINLPLVMGADGAGLISEVGSEVSGFNVGDRVVIQPGVFDPKCKLSQAGRENLSPTYGILGETHNGVQSEYVCLAPSNVFKMPNSISFSDMSSMPLTFMTSHNMLINKAKISKDDVVLIYGGASGVGSAAIQITKDIGCKTIISTVGSKDKFSYVEQFLNRCLKLGGRAEGWSGG